MSIRREFRQLLPAVSAAFAVARILVLAESPAQAQQIDPGVGRFQVSGKSRAANGLIVATISGDHQPTRHDES
ncbi:MAG: hypothetical protein JOY71_20630 [Acetobacteraceae bacterium]|nr:hypothetical protein [Acetobacteraceae bacterium]